MARVCVSWSTCAKSCNWDVNPTHKEMTARRYFTTWKLVVAEVGALVVWLRVKAALASTWVLAAGPMSPALPMHRRQCLAEPEC